MKKLIKLTAIASCLSATGIILVTNSSCTRQKSETEVLWEKYDYNKAHAATESTDLAGYRSSWEKEANDQNTLENMIKYTIFSFILVPGLEVFNGYSLDATKSIYDLCKENKVNLLINSSFVNIKKNSPTDFTIDYIGKLTISVIGDVTLDGSTSETLKKGDQMGFTYSIIDVPFNPNDNKNVNVTSAETPCFYEEFSKGKGEIFGIQEIIQNNKPWGLSSIKYVGTKYDSKTVPTYLNLNVKE